GGLEVGRVGGGIYSQGDLTLRYSSVVENNTDIEGGGIYSSGTLTVFASTITGNTAGSTARNAGYGGGIASYGTLRVENSTIEGNDAIASPAPEMGETRAVGGGIYHSSSSYPAEILNSTIVGNIVSANSYAHGGGIFNNYAGTMTVTGSIIAGN